MPASAVSMVRLVALISSLAMVVYGFPTQATTPAVDQDITQTIEANLSQGHAKLNDMFREVEKLMEDTQHKLQEAVYQMDNESARSILYVHDLPPNYQEESSTDRTVGNQTVHTVEKINKVTDNRTGETHFSRTVIQSSSQENKVHHECIIDEDCEKGRYCLYETLRSRCLPCKALDMPCTKDEECCSGQLCVWGQCSENTTKGQPGSICQYQSDCNTELCCAFHKALLFPVCTTTPVEGEHCRSRPSHLMELLSWDMEGEGPREHCPCAGGLQCQPRGRGFLCLKPQNSSSEEDLTDTLYSEIDYIV
ncbi:dickkopf-related protein 3-like isoform X1 [Conger conger]|uniref:dickkopf-related protein 3-like isoform X1 n=1 Tax=Conger conger TaxID=82655 RepID=UPI002A59C839|nr:dickkopf-related protein 3-like isoform X1 [Conger conger]